MKLVLIFRSIFLCLRKTAKLFLVNNQHTLFQTTNYQIVYERNGYSLVEVLVAITVLLIALVGPLTIAHTGLKRATESKDSTLAIFLAQEGIEAVVKLREDNALSASAFNNLAGVWGNMTAIGGLCPVGGSNKCGVQIGEDGSITTASFYRCSGSNSCVINEHANARVPLKQRASGGVATIYTREITITVTNEMARVRSEVYWGTDPSDRVVLDTYLYNTYYVP